MVHEKRATKVDAVSGSEQELLNKIELYRYEISRISYSEQLCKNELIKRNEEIVNLKGIVGELRRSQKKLKTTFSWRIGYCITFVPRTIFNRICKLVTPIAKSFSGPFRIWKVFKNEILNGFSYYSSIIWKYGENTHIYKTSGGTGDVYIAGMYFAEYLKMHNPGTKPVFTVIHESGKVVAEMFGIENIELISYRARRDIVHLGIFLGFDHIHFTVIHHNPASLYTSILSKMESIHEMSSFDVLKYTIYEGIQPTGTAKFCGESSFIERIFKENGLRKGKTVILIPYSVSMTPIPKLFWEHLTKQLIQNGYTVCTNSASDKEHAIKGTCLVNIPIPQLVPFLNAAGFLVGVRTGILDVTERAKLKRVILYSDVRNGGRGGGGHITRFLPHFSFNKWFGRNDAFEIEYNDNLVGYYTEEIIKFLNSSEEGNHNEADA